MVEQPPPPRRRDYYRPGPLDSVPDPAPITDLEILIEDHTAVYRDPRMKAWMEQRLRAWWAKGQT